MPTFVPPAEQRPEGVSFDPVKAGSYRLQLVKLEGTYANSGNELLKWQFEIIDSGKDDVDGSRIFHNSTLVEKSMAYPNTGFWDMLSMFGVLDELEGQDMSVEDLAAFLDENLCQNGATCFATVGIRTYNGKKYNEITKFEADSDEDDAPAEATTDSPKAEASIPTTSPSNEDVPQDVIDARARGNIRPAAKTAAKTAGPRAAAKTGGPARY